MHFLTGSECKSCWQPHFLLTQTQCRPPPDCSILPPTIFTSLDQFSVDRSTLSKQDLHCAGSQGQHQNAFSFWHPERQACHGLRCFASSLATSCLCLPGSCKVCCPSFGSLTCFSFAAGQGTLRKPPAWKG